MINIFLLLLIGYLILVLIKSYRITIITELDDLNLKRLPTKGMLFFFNYFLKPTNVCVCVCFYYGMRLEKDVPSK